jgi:molybdate transport system substrate-binding protein
MKIDSHNDPHWKLDMTRVREFSEETAVAARLRFICTLLLTLTLALVAPGVAAAEEITVAAASDLTFVFPEVAAKFQKDTGNTVKFSFGSSGNFLSQIQNGAPFDVFFSADIGYPKKLEGAGLVEPGTFYEYAVGKVVLWVLNASRLDLKQGLAVLTDDSIHKIAIANPEHAPYGRAAVAAMKHDGVYDKVSGKLVMGENISQTAQFVQSGSADIGLLALSLAVAPSMKEKGRYELVPPADYPPIEQAAVVIKTSKKKDTAKQFLDYVKKPEIVSLMRAYGFAIQDSAPAAAN